ncbi:unnamed protein product [Lactuca saligna]|uniref:SWIM-type domain-containing protein n=1 Tax=Lactuca saligna TaxID=75948 RepID=A0AA35ZZB3_LACSI|nr:unnamed protein product [Lactuca saligna]
MSISTPNPDGLYPIVELNFKGVFLRNPFSYNHGINFTFNDHDFSGMTYGECITFLERFMQEIIKKLYYCEPGKPLISGITAIANDEDYGGFIFHVYRTYEEEDGDDSSIDGGENEEEIDSLTDVDVDFNKDIVTMNRTKGDEFLNRLCGEDEEGNDNNINDHDGHEEDANVTQQHSIFNELVPWKKQIPILGMRFKDPSQLKSMLCNYVVANGYQLCFEKNDRKRLLVKCCKGICKGELLCAVGRDANNGIYLIAWAVVCVENKESWRWFLDLLIDDLGLNLGYGYCVISDQHKSIGSVPSILAKTLGKGIMVPNMKAFSRRHVKQQQRKKPIITMLEELRMYMMERVFKKKCKGLRWGNKICPTIREIVNAIKKILIHYQVLPIGLNQFEVRGTTDAYEVDLEERTCSCRLWQLNGIGCVHSVAAISFMNRDVESYVDKMFSSITYMKAYKLRAMPGRPATKRKRDATETPNQSSKKLKTTTQTQNKGKEHVKVSKGVGAVNDGGAVTHGGEAVNDGGAINDGAKAVNEVHVQ